MFDSPKEPSTKYNQGAIENFYAGGEGSMDFFFAGDWLRIFFRAKPEVWFVSDAYQKRSKWILIIRSW
jgi:hypothetical protein